jgi:hypothetical protein
MLENVNEKTKWVFVVLIMSLIATPTKRAAGELISGQIKIGDNELAVDIQGVPLIEILEYIKMQTGITYAARNNVVDEIISTNFGFLPFEKAFARILLRFNYAILTEENDKVQQVIILSTNGSSRKKQREFEETQQPMTGKVLAETGLDGGTDDYDKDIENGQMVSSYSPIIDDEMASWVSDE